MVMLKRGPDGRASRRLQDKVAIVTGAGSKRVGGREELVGTGRAIAVQLAHEGVSVLVVDRHSDRAHDTRAMIEKEGGVASTLVLDLTHPEAPERIAAEARDRFGGIDILVSNAAAYSPPKFLETSRQDLQAALAVNLVAPFMLTQAVLPAMIDGGGGAVIYISSILAMRGAGPVPYAASKAGLMGLATSLANSFGAQGVRFNCVAPGMVDTPIRHQLAERAGVDLAANERFSATPLAVRGDAWDVAHTVAFLASEEGRYLTGLLIPVDGGATTRL
jgi:NAD(P)-dependent dehydrogenase (short-subunit alcohol dehydrogenase family)